MSILAICWPDATDSQRELALHGFEAALNRQHYTVLPPVTCCCIRPCKHTMPMLAPEAELAAREVALPIAQYRQPRR